MRVGMVRAMIRRDVRRENSRRHVAESIAFLVYAVVALGLAALVAALGR